MTWQQADITVARWLADQLGYTQLVEALRGLRNLKFDPSTCIWSLPEGEEAKQAEKTTPETSNSSFLPRLEDIRREQIVNHIRRSVESSNFYRFPLSVPGIDIDLLLFRLLIQYPECIDEAQDCIQILQSTRPLSPSTVIGRHTSESSLETVSKT